MSARPPVAKQIPHSVTLHGDTREDEYHWLRNREDPDTLAYLHAENLYLEEVMAPHAELREELYREMRARVVEDDQSVPEKIDDWYYYSRDVAGKQYKVYCRKMGSLDAPEQVILDLNAWAQEGEYLSLGIFDVSDDHRLLAFSLDTDGSEHYLLRFLEIDTGRLLPDEIPDTQDSFAWAADNQTCFYTRLDEHDRPDRVLRHLLGTPHESDVTVYQETDSRFFVGCGRSKSREWILIQTGGKITTEVHVIRTSDPLAPARCVEPRREGVEYSVEHHGQEFLILTNDQARNFRLMSAPVDHPGRSNWKERFAHDPSRYLTGVEAFASHLVVSMREQGLTKLRVIDSRDWSGRTVEFPEEAYVVGSLGTPEYSSPTFRLAYESMTTPPMVFDCRFSDLGLELKKQRKTPNFDPAQYVSGRILARSHDGTLVPVCYLHRRDLKLDGNVPVLLYGYGSYGIDTDPGFSANATVLCDQGFIWADAQIRGGSEMGRHWYEDGKFLKKKNTFQDFIACAEALCSAGLTKPGNIAIMGGSAGGMLVGGCINQRPELFRAAVAMVPFVDVLNTMLDETLPLTPTEYDEWGNPQDRNYYFAMKEYSPYDNVEAKDYPHLLITAGLNDPRVPYWEPAKWCARLRAKKTDRNLLLLKTEMGAGHSGASGRYERLKELALIFAFLKVSFGHA